jgi:hypothetical protein
MTRKEKLKLAKDHTTPRITLAELADDEDFELRVTLASNPNTPPQALDYLSDDKQYWQVRRVVACNLNTPPFTLFKLNADENYFVRTWAKKNPNTKNLPEVYKVFLRQLNLQDYDENRSTPDEYRNHIYPSEMLELASNPNTSSKALAIMARDNNRHVRSAVAGNPNTPLETLTELAMDKDHFVRVDIPSNPSTPLATLIELTDDTLWIVRLRVAYSLKTPAEILTKLVKDENSLVRKTAMDNPNTPKTKGTE